MTAEADAKAVGETPAEAVKDAEAALHVDAKPKLVRRLYLWCMKWADTPYALPALGVMAFAEASFFPIPPDALLLPMCFAAPKKAIKYALFCTLASVVGGMFGYYIGSALWGQLHDFFIPRFFSQVAFDGIQKTYVDNAFAIIAAKGLTPIPFKLVTISAGVAGVPFGTFVAAAVVCRSIRFMTEGVLVYFFGAAVRPFIEKYLTPLLLVTLVLFVAGFAALKLLH